MRRLSTLCGTHVGAPFGQNRIRNHGEDVNPQCFWRPIGRKTAPNTSAVAFGAFGLAYCSAACAVSGSDAVLYSGGEDGPGIANSTHSPIDTESIGPREIAVEIQLDPPMITRKDAEIAIAAEAAYHGKDDGGSELAYPSPKL